MGGCATKPKVSKSKAADKPANEPPPEAKKGVTVVMETGDYGERVKEIVNDDNVNDNEHSTHKRPSLSFLFEEVKEAKKEVMVEAGDYSERVKEIVGYGDENDKVDKHDIRKRPSLRLLFDEVKETNKEMMVEEGDYCEQVEEIVSDEDNDKVNKHGTRKYCGSLSILFEEVKEEAKQEVTTEVGDCSERVKEIVGDNDDNDEVDKHGTCKLRSLSLLFEEIEEAKKDMINMVDARDYGDSVKEIIGDDDFTDKIDEHGTHKRRSLSLLFKEEGQESATMDEASTELSKQVKEPRQGENPSSNLASKPKQSGKSEATDEEQLAFAAGNAAQEGSEETQDIDMATPKLMRKSKQLEKIKERADENVEII